MSETQPKTPPIFVISRAFDAPRARVWKAWTQPEDLAQWFGPKGTQTRVIRHELEPGGVLHSALTAPDGQVMYGLFTYTEIIPESRLVWVHCFGDEQGNIVRHPMSPTWPMKLLTTVTFEDEGAKTKVTLKWKPFDTTQEERDTFAGAMAGMEGGWNGSFDQMEAWLAG